jgi:hypothetical protein
MKEYLTIYDNLPDYIYMNKFDHELIEMYLKKLKI